MYQLIGAVLYGWLLLAGVVLAADEQIVVDLNGNGSRTTRPFSFRLAQVQTPGISLDGYLC